ncbi:vomeronasal type-1 receptor 4-like [Cricetulus griseus]|nr:vomeronasal type-1 receptor 4-like [Cricetulus griseus]XP_027254469.1 vomeronasal type-1 receptor 4-like [Cricetulus griseus]
MQGPKTQTPDPDRRAASDVTMGMIFLSQTVVGVLGNSCLLYYYVFLYFTQSRLRSTDWVLMHLIVANFLTLLCKGVPQTMAGFGWKDFLDDSGCRGLFYLHKVGRNVSFSSISFLSAFQAITISPKDSKWAALKFKAPKYAVYWINLSWILNLLINTVFLTNISSKQGNENITMLKDFGYCSSVNLGIMDLVLHVVYLSFPDVICMWLMLWTSGSMVLILYRHKQRMQHILRGKVSPASSPETRATQTILLMVSTFICFYLLSCICQICLALVYNPSWFLVNMSVLISGCFPTVSPFLLMRSNSCVLTVCFMCVRI